jgi:hypothetical protein
MNGTTLYGLLACAALLGIGISLLPHGWRRLPLAVGSASLALAPIIGGESPAMWVHGALGAPSLTLLLIAGKRLLAPASPPLLNRPAAALILGVALVFYPLALGLGPFDPYTHGYQPLTLLLALAPLGSWLAWRRHDTWLLVLSLDLLAYAAGVFGNLWDALFDPLVVLLAAISLLAGFARR